MVNSRNFRSYVDDLIHRCCTDNLPIILSGKGGTRPSSSTDTVIGKRTRKAGFEQFTNSNVLATPMLTSRFNGIQTNEAALKKKDFKTRLFLTCMRRPILSHDNHLETETTGACNNFWIRTHHSDCIAVIPNPSDFINNVDDDNNGSSDCPFHQVKEYFHAAYTKQDHMVAKATLTKLMSTIYQYEKEEYCAFTSILASGLSEMAGHTSFHAECSDDTQNKGQGLVKELKDVEGARERLVVLMDILFRMMTVKRFLIDDDFCNIFRLVHCETKGQRNKLSLTYVFFSCLLQSCLAIFVVTEVLEEFRGAEQANNYYYNQQEQEIQIRYVILASLGSIFGFLSQLSEFRNAYKVYNFYGKFGTLQAIDFTVNVIIPLLIIIVGFWLVANQDNIVDAVLMTTALLFIPEIDDQLPGLLGFDRDAVIETYLVREAKSLYNNNLRLDDDQLLLDVDSMCASFLRSGTNTNHGNSSKMGVEFSDYFISNPHTGTETADGSSADTYNPKENSLKLFSVDHDSTYGHEISPSNFLSDDCLIQTVEWTYTDETTARTISWLRLVKMNGEIIEKSYTSTSEPDRLGKVHQICGAFVITDIVMENSYISTLRICGSERACDFKDAVEYYSLWDMTKEAKYLLKNVALNPSINRKVGVEGTTNINNGKDDGNGDAYHSMA